ncbi:MAG TPA: hypothetical protein VN752_07670, partial [Solirubrobacterales bacterium]|nr:hypothetical protein [Solirubrobacterales bacterium]
MRRLLLSLLCLVLAMAMLVAPAEADFGLSNPEVAFTEEDESPATLAGSHPFAMRTSFEVNTTIGPKGFITVDGALRDLHVTAPAGFVGDTTAAPQCDALDFIGKTCSPNTALGTFRAVLMGGLGITGEETVPIYNLNPSPGSATRYGFIVAALPIYLNVTIKPTYPFNVVASSVNVSQIVELLAADTILWGNPASPSHDKARGKCALSDTDHNGDTLDDDICPSTLDEQAYLTLPRSCTGPLSTDFEALAWWSGDPVAPDPIPATFSDTVQSDAMEDCAALGFAPEVRAAPTTNLASSPSGFEFGIEVDDPGLKDPTQRADSDLKKAVVTLPEGMTVNPAAGGGLSACSQAQLANETSDSDFGAGCPAASRVASVEVDTPLLKEHVSGSVFLAEPYSNPLGTLLAGYLVIKQPERGIVVKLPGRIDADPNTGQLTASFDQNPQFPFSSLQVSFFPGPRAALTTPDACGDYAIETELYPWSGNAPDVSTQPFTIAGAPGGGSCPASASGLPHAPSFDAGTASPIAKAYSPFLVNLRRPDGSQRFSTVSLTPPPGLVAKLAGTAICTEGALTAAQARSGKEEQAAPSCPAASRVGSVYAALGSGPDPYWAPGTAYLTGPYKGAPLSMAIVSPAVAGPFDLGVVVIRVALHLDPVSARITAVSDPIPPFLEGIPLDVRVASVRLDRPQFTLN